MVLLSIDFASLHTILESLYNEMMPLCEDMLGVAKGVAGLGALFYVALRVWQSMARAEPVDVYPLLRPFALGICILLFPTLVLGTMNSILSPIVQGTHRMLEGQTLDMQQYRAQMPSESVRMAIAIVIVIPIACAYPFFQKYFISGLTIGAVKG